jgi:thiol-disulfide isomerase/thioredoxin
MKQITTIIILLLCSKLNAQSITGTFPEAKNKEIVLKGYNGFKDKLLSQTTTDAQGKFVLRYPKEFVGAAMLSIQNSSSLIVLLNQENFSIQWYNLQDMGSLKFTHSPENEGFANGIFAYQAAEQKLSGLNYLLLLYANDSAMQNVLKKDITKQQLAFDKYIQDLPQNAYVGYYLNLRKLLTQLSKQDIDSNSKRELMSKYSKLNFGDDKLWSSGLLKELVEGYYKIIIGDGRDTNILAIVNQASTVWINSLKTHSTKQQELAEHVFKLMEQIQAFGAAEHIALAMLNQTNCQLDNQRLKLFEQYRKLGLGQIAPNIMLSNAQNLKAINSKYKLVVFGASWCPNCQTDYPSLMGMYNKYKSSSDSLSVIYISIDKDIEAFKNYYKDAPFITFCDGKGWETQAAIDYCVFATPTYFLLDRDLKIVAKLQSPLQFEDWLNQVKMVGN